MSRILKNSFLGQKLKSVPRIFSLHFSDTVTRNANLNICERKALSLSRYLLLILTSFFYLVGPPANSFHIKLFVVEALVVATILAQNLYDSWYLKAHNGEADSSEEDNGLPQQADLKLQGLKRLALAETLGIVLLIIPTGGLDSPFAWYALNPIIAVAYFVPAIYGWEVLGLFLASACGISQLYPGHGPFLSFIYNHLSQFMVFFLTTSLVQVAAALHKSIVVAYEKAESAHHASEKALLHISSLYQALEAFSTREDHQQLAEVLAEYTARLVSQPAACLLQRLNSKKFIPVTTVLCLSPSPANIEINWPEEMQKLWARVESGDDFLTQVSGPYSRITAKPIMSHGQCFGLLAFWDDNDLNRNYKDEKKSLQFLADLGGITLERLQSDQLWGRLLVSEERNRISNEMHDTIAQDLFSITCAIHALSREESDLQDKKVQEQLKLLANTAQRAASELRASIYSLNPAKRGESVFVDNLASYLDDLGRLNRVKVDLQTEGSEDVLSPALRKGLYRIIREACSNAIRHGRCSALQVCLSMKTSETVLAIKDNGCSFNHKAGNWQPGLGIRNMKQIAASFMGELQIQRNPDGGTLVLCTIPGKYHPEVDSKEAIVS